MRDHKQIMFLHLIQSTKNKTILLQFFINLWDPHHIQIHYNYHNLNFILLVLLHRFTQQQFLNEFLSQNYFEHNVLAKDLIVILESCSLSFNDLI